MSGEDGSRELPQRVRGAAQARAAPSAAPVLSDELRQRMRAAVKAEREQAAEQDQEHTTEPSRPVTASGPEGGDKKSPAVNGLPKRVAKADPAVEPDPAVKFQPAVPAQRALMAQPAVAAPPAVEPQPAKDMLANHSPAPAVQARPVRVAPQKASAQNRPRRRRLIIVRWVAWLLVFFGIGSAAVVIAAHVASSSGDSGKAGAALQRQELAARDQAASWVAQQVSHSAIVSCDPQMCAALAAAGFPPHELLELRQTSPSYPLSSAVVVVTAAVRDLFGSSLGTAYAPAVIASFGSGAAQISVRVIAPQGARAYEALFIADLGDRKTSGNALLQASDITASASAAKQLIAGQVDSRLLLAIAALAGDEPIDIVQFGNAGPGASPGVPLRSADLSENDQAAHMASPAYVQSMRANLDAVSIRFRPTSIETVTYPEGQSVLRVEFSAPSPLGLFSTNGSP